MAGLNIYTTDKVSPRCFPWLWFVRIAQMVLTIIILAIASSNAQDFSSIPGCNVPSRIGYNIAAVGLDGLCLPIAVG